MPRRTKRVDQRRKDLRPALPRLRFSLTAQVYPSADTFLLHVPLVNQAAIALARVSRHSRSSPGVSQQKSGCGPGEDRSRNTERTQPLENGETTERDVTQIPFDKDHTNHPVQGGEERDRPRLIACAATGSTSLPKDSRPWCRRTPPSGCKQSRLPVALPSSRLPPEDAARRHCP